MKNTFIRFAVLMSALSTVLPSAAEDIDLYAGVNASGGLPNVLFFIDNSSNWSTAQFNWTKAGATAKCNAMTDAGQRSVCLSYVTDVFGVGVTELTQGQVELRALKLVLNALICGTGSKLQLNAGLMLHNPQGTVDSNGSTSGYIRVAIKNLPTNCGDFIGVLDQMDASITTPDYKGPSSTEYGANLYEAFKYFGGWTNPAGVQTQTAGSPVGATGFGPIRHSRKMADHLEDPLAFTDATRTTYKSPIDNGACGNNYIVLLGNQWPNAEWGANTNSNPPSLTQFTRLGFSTGQLYAANNKANIRFADEWAKFLFTTDVSDVDGQQNVRMFTVDVFNTTNSNSPNIPRQSELLQSMADASGPGGYFKVDGDLYKLVMAFTDIVTKIAAVNSIFASPSLPVSVNSQGTFLNQVFMGLFRPDGDAQQRWLGNLKQYRFALDGNSLYLADSTTDANTGKPRAAVAKRSGFLDNCATSYWTSDSGSYWETLTGLNSASSCLGTYPGSAFSDKPDGPIVERGGAAQRLRTLGHANRNIRTCLDTGCKVLGAYKMVDFDATTLIASPVNATLVNWLRAKNTGDGSIKASDGSVSYSQYGLADTATRPTVHGDVVHSRPLAVNYGADATSDVVVFYGAGDGMLRAIDGNQSGGGGELWAFVAPEHWIDPDGSGAATSPLDRVRTNTPLVSYPSVSSTLTPAPTPRSWFFDGSIGGYQERDASGSTKVWIYATMRRGGSAIYAFDVSKKPANSVSNQPTLMWKYSALDEARMGQSWSMPTAIRIKGMADPLVVFGAGYDSCDDDEDPNAKCSGVSRGQGVVVMDAKDGPGVTGHYRFIGVGSGLDASAGRFVADITTVDVNKDGYVDVLYAADTRGNVWRINTSDPANGYVGYTGGVSAWPVVKIAAVGEWGASLSERRKFMYAPSVVALAGQVTVLIGSGDREKPSDSSNAAKVNNRFYGFRDDVTITANCTAADSTSSTTCIRPVAGHGTPTELMDVTSLSPIDPTAQAAYRGWFRNLATTTPPYEQVVTTPLTLAGVTYFSTYRAKDTTASNTCVNLGTGYGYQIDFQTGTKLADEPLVDDFTTEGIPPSPVGGVVLIDGKRVPFCIGCPGDSVLDPTKIKPKVKPDRKPVYRYRQIDKS